MSRRAVAALLTVVLGLAAAVGGLVLTRDDDPPGRRAAAAPRTAAAPPPDTVASTVAPTTAVPTTVVPPCSVDPTLAQPPLAPSPVLAGALGAFLSHPTVAPHRVSVSVWVDGWGEVLAHDPELPLAPASNEKLFTAMGALAVLGSGAPLTTEVRTTPSGDLAVVGGGDATVTRAGPHSVDALADQVQASGVTHVPGALVVDETRHDGARRAAGWLDWQIPTYTGPLSAFMVDHNRWRSDAAFVADPALANGELLRAALAARGVVVAGPTAYAAAPARGTSSPRS